MASRAAELANAELPRELDSVSFLPVLLGDHVRQREHDYLYWEFYEHGSKQAVRQGRWKAVRRPMLTGPIELFDLETDLGEQTNVATEHPELAAKMEAIMDEAHVADERWPVPKPRRK